MVGLHLVVKWIGLCSQGTRPLTVLAWMCPRQPGREPHLPVPPPLPLCKAPLGLLPSPGTPPRPADRRSQGLCPRVQKWFYEKFGEYVEDFRFQPEETTVETEEPLSARRWGPGGGRGGGAAVPAGQDSSGPTSKAREVLRGRPHGRAPQSVVVLVLCDRRHAGTVATPGVPAGRAGPSDSGGGGVGGRQGSLPPWVTRAPRGPAGSCGVRTRLRPSGCWRSSLPPS